jgi:hypothetical protein
MKNLKPSYKELINYIRYNEKSAEILVANYEYGKEFTAYKLDNQDYFLIILSDSNGYPYINFYYNHNDKLDYMFVESADENDFLNSILNRYYSSFFSVNAEWINDINLKSKVAFELIEKSISNYCMINWDALDYEDKLIKQNI